MLLHLFVLFQIESYSSIKEIYFVWVSCNLVVVLFNRHSSLKCFKSQNFSVQQSFQMPPLWDPWMFDIIFQFMLALFLHLSSSTSIRKFNAAEMIFKWSFCNTEIFIWFTGCWLLYIQCLPLNIYYLVDIRLCFCNCIYGY